MGRGIAEIIKRSDASDPIGGDDRTAPPGHVAADKTDPARERTDQQKEGEADRHMGPIEIRPERRHHPAQENEEDRRDGMFDGHREGVQALVEPVPALRPSADEARHESRYEPVTLRQFHEAIGKEHAGEGQHPGPEDARVLLPGSRNRIRPKSQPIPARRKVPVAMR